MRTEQDWLDPNEVNEISLATSRRNIARLKRDGLIFKNPNVVHSRARVTLRNEAKRKGRRAGKLYSILYNLFLFCQSLFIDTRGGGYLNVLKI